MHVWTVPSAIHQFVIVNIWSEGGFRQRRSPSSTFFCPALDPPFGISGQNRYQNGSIPSKAFCLWSSLWLFLALPWIQPRADLITRAPRGTDRSPEYNEHFCYKLDSRVKNLTTEWNQKQQHFITHASRSLLWIRFVAVAFRFPPPCDLFCLALDLLLGNYGKNIFMHVQGHEHFIHTKFRNYSWSGSVVKLAMCSHTYTCISAPLLFLY